MQEGRNGRTDGIPSDLDEQPTSPPEITNEEQCPSTAKSMSRIESNSQLR